MSQTALGERMTERGSPWSRTSVQKLETGNRASISVQEQLALALVFDVPPVWLLADPTSAETVPVAAGVNLDPWSALLWMVGRQPLQREPGVWWARISPALGRIYAVASAVDQLRQNEPTDPNLTGHIDDEAERAEKDRRLLRLIVSSVREIERSGLVLPVLPDDVRARADELDVGLPGTEG